MSEELERKRMLNAIKDNTKAINDHAKALLGLTKALENHDRLTREMHQEKMGRPSRDDPSFLCPKDGQTKEWHQRAVLESIDGKVTTNGQIAGCDYGKEYDEEPPSNLS